MNIGKLFRALFQSKGRITIDGRNFVGRNITIHNDKVIVDGVEQSGSLVGPVSVTVHGDVDRLETVSGNVEVSGACLGAKTVSGDIRCRDVAGNVSTISGNVTCGRIGGSAKSMSGDICGGQS